MSATAGLALAAVATLTLVTLVAAFRTDSGNPVNDLSFFRMKLAWSAEADITVLGNSQVYRGMDPRGFAQTCPGPKVLNFGFSGTLMRPEYLEASLKSLRPDGPRVLLVGVNPLEFKDRRLSDGFVIAREHDRQFKLPWQIEATLQPVLHRLRPLEAPIPGARRVTWDFRPDGFVASNSPPREVGAARQNRYRNEYLSKPFSPEMYEGMLAQLAKLRQAGYRVLLFSTYSSPAFEAIDVEMTGLDDARLAADAARYDLTFLPLSVHGLRSYDGTHLDSGSATEFARRLGAAVKHVTGNALCKERNGAVG
jgi:hypothetical protein